MKQPFNIKGSAIYILLLLFFVSCYQIDPEYTDELDLTITYYNTEFDFSSNNTYVLRDSIGLLQNHMTDIEVAEFYAPYGTADKLKAKAKDEFDAHGYAEIKDIANADLGVNVVHIDVRSPGIVYCPPGWWGQYPGYYPGWGYPRWDYSYSYYESTVMLEMVDGASVRQWLTWANGKNNEEIQAGNGAPDMEYQWQAFNGLIRKPLNNRHI